jgi:hypothetical protein
MLVAIGNAVWLDLCFLLELFTARSGCCMDKTACADKSYCLLGYE